MIYLRLFDSVDNYESAKSSLVTPNVSYVTSTGEVYYLKWGDDSGDNDDCQYLKFTAVEDNSTVTLDTWNDMEADVVPFSNTGMTLYYSTDGESYTQWTGQTITLNANESIYVYGDNANIDTWETENDDGEPLYPHFSMEGKIKASGNIQSMISKDMPDTIPFVNCYAYMFEFCTSLTAAPELPATTLAEKCYYYMFYGCTSLATAHKLPATTLAESCYSNMFYGCTSLATAPELCATTLAVSCCDCMFEDCTSLTAAPELPATTLAEDCYNGIFKGCTSLTTVPELPATTLTKHCYSGMFKGCTSLATAPGLPATTLTNYCYYSMFDGCTSLVTAPELPATTLAENCYERMFNGCTSLTAAPELPATTLADDCYLSMFEGCSNLNYIKAMFTTTPSSKYTDSWVYGVSSSGTFVKNSAATWSVTGVNGIPSNWTVETASA